MEVHIMHMSGSCIIVPKDTLAETPKAFQDYVKRYFKSRKIRGEGYFIAVGTLGLSNQHTGKGVAPTHSVSKMAFKDGLSEGIDLSEWMEKNEGTFFWEIHADWDDGNITPVSYD